MGSPIVRTLSRAEARAFYDKFGSRQDQQAFYEDAAVNAMVAHAAMAHAQFVVEFGCGTGRLALELLERHLPDGSRYLGTDISSTMVAIAGERLRPYASRASVMPTNGSPELPVQDASVDRVIATYVFDLLGEADRTQFLAESARVLSSDGLLCLVGITDGNSAMSRAVMAAWRGIFAFKPRLVGGCRPTRAIEYVRAGSWRIQYHEVLVSWGIASAPSAGHPDALLADAEKQVSEINELTKNGS